MSEANESGCCSIGSFRCKQVGEQSEMIDLLLDISSQLQPTEAYIIARKEEAEAELMPSRSGCCMENLRELLSAAEIYGWEPVKVFHAV